MLRISNYCRLIALGLLFFLDVAAYATDMDEGQKLYKVGKLAQAKAYFARAIDTNASNASAHYFMGHCLVGEKNYSGAAAEYRRAMELTDDKKMEDYCRIALQRLGPLAEPRVTAPVKPTSTRVNTQITGIDTKTERVKAIMSKAKSEAKTVVDRGDERCRPIQDEEKAAMATMSIRLRGRSGSIETTTPEERGEARQEYERKIEAIKRDAKTQAQNILEQARRDAGSVGQGLPNLDELLK